MVVNFDTPPAATAAGAGAPQVTPYQKRMIGLGWQSPVKTFSAAAEIDDTLATELEQIFASTFGSLARNTLLASKTHCDQWVMVWEDRFVMLSATKAFHGGADAVVIVSATDDLGGSCPISIPFEYFTGNFTTLVKKEEAATYNLGVSATAPDQIPTVDDQQGSWENTRFPGIDPENDATHPVISLLPCCFPLPKGTSFTGTHPISDGVPTLNKAFPFFAVWCKGISWNIVENEGFSAIQTGGPLFTVDIVNVTTFTNLDLQPRILTNFHGVTPGNAHSPHYEKHFTKVMTDALFILGTMQEDIVQPNFTNPGTPQPEAPAGRTADTALSESFTRLANSMQSKKDKETVVKGAASTNRLSILLAQIVPNGHNDPTIIPATVKKDVMEALFRTSVTHAAEELQSLFDSHLRSLNSNVTLEDNVTLDKHQIDAPFVSALRSGR